MNKFENKAYSEGWDAGFATNYQDYHNPYEPGTTDHKSWSEGFQRGNLNWDMNMDD